MKIHSQPNLLTQPDHSVNIESDDDDDIDTSQKSSDDDSVLDDSSNFTTSLAESTLLTQPNPPDDINNDNNDHDNLTQPNPPDDINNDDKDNITKPNPPDDINTDDKNNLTPPNPPDDINNNSKRKFASISVTSYLSDTNLSPPHKKSKNNLVAIETSKVSKNPVTFSETIAHVKEINTNESSAAVALAPDIEVNEIDQESDNAPKKSQ